MLWSRIPLIITGSYRKARRAREAAQKNMVRIAQENSRVDSGTMRAGWEDEEISALEGRVFNLVAWTVHNEYGTIHMSAQPMLRPAVEQTNKVFHSEVARIYR